MIVVAFVSFSLFNFVGDPVNSMTGEDASDERRAEVREVLGLNDPVYIQFGRFLGNIVHGLYYLKIVQIEYIQDHLILIPLLPQPFFHQKHPPLSYCLQDHLQN